LQGDSELFETGRSKRFGSIEKVATRKLAQLDAAETLEFLRSPPGNRLEELKATATASTAFASMISGAFAFDGPRLDRQTLRSWSTTEEHRVMAFKNGMRPVHPGEVLREYLIPLGMSVNALAKALGVPTPRINDVVREKRGITPDTAMRLARYFGGDARSWLNLQIAYDLRIAEIASAKSIARSVAPMKKAS
jgi:antitoxin HigA-1